VPVQLEEVIDSPVVRVESRQRFVCYAHRLTPPVVGDESLCIVLKIVHKMSYPAYMS